MGRKRIMAGIITVVLTSTLLFGCNTKSEEKNSNGTKYKFGMIVGADVLDDKSFNSSAIKGLEKAELELNADITIIEASDTNKYEESIKELSKKNDVTIILDKKMKEALENVAKDSADNNFVLIDDVSELPNVKSVVFQEEDGAFLMGIIAGKNTDRDRVGFIGGVDNKLIKKFESGFIAGVKSVNEKAAADLMNKKLVRYVGGFDDVDRAYEKAIELYDEGVDIIFHAAGEAGIGIMKAASEKNGYVIGVDEDQAEVLPEYKEIIISSLVKRTDKAVFDSCKEFTEGIFKAGTENNVEMGLGNGGIEVAKSTSYNVTQGVLEVVDKYKTAIEDKEIIVPTTDEELQGFKIPEI